MRRLYTFLLYLLSPLLILRLYWKSRGLPGYRHRIPERFCLHRQSGAVDIWLHAVSLGEVVAATPLIQALINKGHRLMVTTMTPTGSQQVLKTFGQHVAHQYVPYDLPWVIRRFYQRLQPRLGIIMETELWPNLINEAEHFNIPLMLVNARISDNAFRQYQRFPHFFKQVLNQFMTILAQSGEDAERFISLGALPSRVQMGGNLKFDIVVKEADSSLLSLPQSWGKQRIVLIAASTHDDEENQILQRLSRLKEAIPNLLLLIAPRHPERFTRVFQLCQQLGLNTGLRSQVDSINTATDVVVLDSMGELNTFFSLSNYAFVGGSLVPIGGHNVLEPIAANVPVFCGPFMNNSKAICDELCRAQALKKVVDADELVEAIIALHQSPSQRERQIKQASNVLKANQGTLQRCLAYIEQLL